MTLLYFPEPTTQEINVNGLIALFAYIAERYEARMKFEAAYLRSKREIEADEPGEVEAPYRQGAPWGLLIGGAR